MTVPTGRGEHRSCAVRRAGVCQAGASSVGGSSAGAVSVPTGSSTVGFGGPAPETRSAASSSQLSWDSLGCTQGRAGGAGGSTAWGDAWGDAWGGITSQGHDLVMKAERPVSLPRLVRVLMEMSLSDDDIGIRNKDSSPALLESLGRGV